MSAFAHAVALLVVLVGDLRDDVGLQLVGLGLLLSLLVAYTDRGPRC